VVRMRDSSRMLIFDCKSTAYCRRGIFVRVMSFYRSMGNVSSPFVSIYPLSKPQIACSPRIVAQTGSRTSEDSIHPWPALRRHIVLHD